VGQHASFYAVWWTLAVGKQGATEPEIKAATFVPDKAFGLADADAVLAEL